MTRQQRLRDLLASVAEWQHASGTDRAWWRRVVRIHIRELRQWHLNPERAAFERAVSKRGRNAP